MVKQEELVKVRTVSKKHLEQIVAPEPRNTEGSLLLRMDAALESGAAKRVGWFRYDHDKIMLHNEFGHGTYYSRQFLTLVEWDGQLFIVPAPERWTADRDDMGPQLFV